MANKDRICEVEGCAKKVRAKGLCASHYEYRRVGQASRRCEVNGCERGHYARGLCKGHYKRFVKTGDVGSPILTKAPPTSCSVDGCEVTAICRKMCSRHYMRWYSREPGADLLAARLTRYPPDAVCEVEGCARRPHQNWLCKLHCRPGRRDKGVDPLRVPTWAGVRCVAPLCDNEARVKGLCPTHYERLLRYGSLARVNQKVCSVCVHPDVLLIEQAHNEGSGRRGRTVSVAERFGISVPALRNHMARHLTEERAMKVAGQEIRRLAEVRATIAMQSGGDE